ncbi:hypothetical protein OVY01_18420 [Robbsia sp. Bb-Pol-6]|uniref:Uncharacterized protein n=1 Tax=Robbsia betulipollinis TaxID=2981849 RepID=A0ABT3ZRG2_9BURK|nr:hypothetical protein [Robbsia betulipollinis]MCY0389126.1 hypothetical protein [Robbsia betulipollinis]
MTRHDRTAPETGHRARFRQRGSTGSAKNTWISGVPLPKSLIREAKCAIRHPDFATSRADFATSPFGRLSLVRLSLSLSNSLKRKKKNTGKESESTRNAVPRVIPVLPSIREAAYFLGHELSANSWHNSWHLMAPVFFGINHLA